MITLDQALKQIEVLEKKIQELQNKQLLNNALFNFNKDLVPIIRDKTNPFHKNNYADINTILATIRPLLSKHKLILTQPEKTNGQFNIVETAISHKDTSDTLVSSLTLPSELKKPQEIGSAITYFRRYTLQSLLGLETQDDDGNLASGKSKKEVINDDF